MKKSNKQSGSAHVIVIIILVIAILGLLGFVFWQNFIEKKNTVVNNTSPTTTTTKAASSPSPAPTSTLATLSLPSYGVEIPYNSTDDTYTVVDATGSNAGAYTVKSKKLAAACGDGTFGTIYQTAKGETKPMTSAPVTVGNYDYSWGAYNPSCTTNSQVDTATAVQKSFENAFKNIKASN